jgi:hypothetical protein
LPPVVDLPMFVEVDLWAGGARLGVAVHRTSLAPRDAPGVPERRESEARHRDHENAYQYDFEQRFAVALELAHVAEQPKRAQHGEHEKGEANHFLKQGPQDPPDVTESVSQMPRGE